ncbi:FAD-binding protein [Adlercreutzia sp. R21]|uniref:FAD-dependent oxidoreductase n=1 Tax=Adlercreutzia wanghongyangiae TaxID=3111451 RepID=UPI002DB9C056|nr:FAD-binding protein [Adlercreutzia sp. R21]MEC4184008.1 FAD-binding protein [Adlercreutzia sp. R21]
MKISNETGVSRRHFLQGAGLAAASVAAAGMLGGCAANGKEETLSETGDAAAAYEPTESMDVDIVVVGSGSSGVAATVQAAELGANTLLLEKKDITGGNGRLTEGMFAINSQMQKDAGVGADVTFTDIIAAEQEFFNYRINNLLWKDMVDASGDNIDWMASHGVQFSGVVDDYHGLGKFDCFHWFDNNGSGSCYIDPMIESAQSLGATVMTETPALDLIIEDGAVRGLYAEKADGGILQVNAKAVILTSGGYAQNEDIMLERGWDLTYSHNNGVEGHDGDGLRMANSAGAHDVSRERCFLREAYSFGIDFFADMSQTIHRGGPVLWVNQDAERYSNEGCGSFVPQCVGNAVHTQTASYMVLSKDVIDTFVGRTGYEGLMADMDDAAAQCPGDNVYKADTIKELAELQGLDAATLQATVDRYNELCDKGADDDFNKDAENLVALKTAPFYIFRQDMAFWTSIGGIDTNRKMEVVTSRGEAIPGLYAAGTDGCNLYRETYTMSVPASCNANNCHSGRVAARSAYETCVKA